MWTCWNKVGRHDDKLEKVTSYLGERLKWLKKHENFGTEERNDMNSM